MKICYKPFLNTGTEPYKHDTLKVHVGEMYWTSLMKNFLQELIKKYRLHTYHLDFSFKWVTFCLLSRSVQKISFHYGNVEI